MHKCWNCACIGEVIYKDILYSVVTLNGVLTLHVQDRGPCKVKLLVVKRLGYGRCWM